MPSHSRSSCAFIVYSSRESAELAIQEAHMKIRDDFDCGPIIVKHANTKEMKLKKRNSEGDGRKVMIIRVNAYSLVFLFILFI